VSGTAAPRTLDASLNTMPKLLERNAVRFADRPAMRFKDLGIWQSWTWSELRREIMLAATGLYVLGLKRGERIAIIGGNRPRMYWTFLAAQSLGAVPVPVYADSVADELAYVLGHAEISMAVVADQEQVDKIQSISERVPTLRHIIYDQPRGLERYDHSQLHSFKSVQDIGAAESKREPRTEAWWLSEIARGGGDDVSVMLYTSGTTGRSKGVMMGSARCIQAAMDTVEFDKLTADDLVLAYLPLAWVGDYYLNFAQAMVAGFCVACPESAETVQNDTREIGPTFYFAPPRVFETLLTRVTIRMEDASTAKKKLFHHYLAVAKRWGEKILNREAGVPLSARLSYGIGNLLVYGPLRNALGFSKVRVAYTAGEAIGPELFQFYRSLGINLKQLYGQTEAFLYVTAQPDGQIHADTVGPATPHVTIKIDPNGEVLYRSPGQFLGYYKEPEKTAEAMTEDGYVKTGDAGFFDDKGHLKIIDRAKDVGKLNNGMLFAPKYIENKLKFYPNIREVVAFGHGRDFVTCFINIDLSAMANWAERNNLVYASYQELAANPRVYDIIRDHVDAVNKSLSQEPMMAGAQVKRFLILHKELDADDGELTRTQKVRRSFIADRYLPLLTALYDGSTQRHIKTEVTFEDGRKGMVEGNVTIVDMQTYPVAAAPVKEAAE